MNLIQNDKEKCKMCFACIRVCPSKAIKVAKRNVEIIQERCVACGGCVSACVPQALTFKSSKDEVKNLLSSHDKVVAIVAPTISGEFHDITDYRRFVGMIRALGFEHVNDVSFGVDLVSYKYMELYNNFQGKYNISANCPVVVSFIEKFYPDLVDNLAPIVSPMIATAMVVKQIYGEDTKIVFIGPCLAAKEEAEIINSKVHIDSVLTFIELRELFIEFGITENVVEFSDFDPPVGGKGSLFPIPRGFLQAADINEDHIATEVISTEGHNNFLKAIKEFQYSSALKQHLNLFYCEGCIMGPGMTPRGRKFTRRTLVIEYTKKRLKIFNKDEWMSNIYKFQNLDLSAQFIIDDQRHQRISEDQIKETLKTLDLSEKRQQLGCSACGYTSCKKFAEAINIGLAKPEMCSPFAINKMRDYIKKLASTNEKLKKAEKALTESEKVAREEHNSARTASETISAMLQKIPSGVVIVDDDLKIIESNKAFIELLGEEAHELNEMVPGLVGADLKTLLPFHKLFSNVLISGEDVLNRDVFFGDVLFNISAFTIRRNKIVGGIIRDMADPEVRKDEVIGRAKEVIKENLETVQQIAFLLGESASKTEKILNSIIRSHTPGKNNKR